MTFEIEELRVPATLDGSPAARDFEQTVDARNAAEEASFGATGMEMREHRGHRLGMLLKIANIQHLQERHPGHPQITTFNAEENRFMLDVNEAVGFVAFAYEGAWLKKLSKLPTARARRRDERSPSCRCRSSPRCRRTTHTARRRSRSG